MSGSPSAPQRAGVAVRIALAASCLLAIAGCGDGDKSGSSKTTRPVDLEGQTSAFGVVVESAYLEAETMSIGCASFGCVEYRFCTVYGTVRNTRTTAIPASLVFTALDGQGVPLDYQAFAPVDLPARETADYRGPFTGKSIEVDCRLIAGLSVRIVAPLAG